jgi:hydroxypyruvate isomerase
MPKFAANLTMMYTEHPFLDRFAAAAKDGFKAVEFPHTISKPQKSRQGWQTTA